MSAVSAGGPARMRALLDFSLGLFTLPDFLPPRREPRWSPVPSQSHKPSMALAPWLWDAGSLTAKLIRHSHGQFRVQVLRQVRARASCGEVRALGIKPYHIALIREVVLMGRGQPWVFARSVLPLSSLTGRLRRLRHQGSKPLGAFLFSQPQLKRSPIALSRISRHHAYVPERLMNAEPVWGRRSIFYIDQKPLLVSEVFLSGFPVTEPPRECYDRE